MAEKIPKTNEDLLARLQSATKRGLTAEEFASQRVSFVYSGMNDKSGMSKADVERALKRA